MIAAAQLPWVVRLIVWLWRVRTSRADLYIGGRRDPYMLRWHLLPKDRWPINIFLHRMVRDDDDRALHDHPWWFVSIILAGGYVEVMPQNPSRWRRRPKTGLQWIWWRRDLSATRTVERRPGSIAFRRAEHPHRLMLRRPAHLGGDSWSLVITGRPVRDWGFYCASGWCDAREYARLTDRESVIGPGCN